MDQLRARIGQQKISYEHLKEEVNRLDKDNDNLRTANFKNAEVSLKKESVMKKLVESLREENENLKSDSKSDNIRAENVILKNEIDSVTNFLYKCFI